MRSERWTEETTSHPFHRDQDPEGSRRVPKKTKSLELGTPVVKRSTRRVRPLPIELVTNNSSERNPVATPHLNQLQKGIVPEFAFLVQSFIARKGPQAVVRRVADELGGKLTPVSFEADSIDPEAMGWGVGIAFERLAHLWLDNQTQDRNKDNKVVDPGSASRVFESLRQSNHRHINFTPDGLLFSNFYSNPVLSALLEYKMSPLSDIDGLKSRLQRMKSFINTFAGWNLRLDTKLDINLPKRTKKFKIARRPKIILVIPDNRAGDIEHIPQNIPVTVFTTPFSNDFVRQVATASLRDFGKTIISDTQK